MGGALAHLETLTAPAFPAWVLKQRNEQGCRSGGLQDPQGAQTLQHVGSHPARTWGRAGGHLALGTPDSIWHCDPRRLLHLLQRSLG